MSGELTISVTGAAGKTGRAIVRALRARGARVRALVHRRERSAEMRRLGAAEVAVADLIDRRSLERAFAGSAAVYLICPNLRSDEPEIGRRVIDACRSAGVRRLAYHSVLHPQIEAMPHHWKKLRVEESLIESGLPFTVLQPAAYMQNVKAQWESVLRRAIYAVPYAPSTRLGMVDLGDVAEIAARVLSEGGHEGAIYELAGPEVMDPKEIAAVIGGRLGREVRVEEISHEAWAGKARAAGLSEYAVDGLLAMFRHYERFGFDGSPTVLEALLERPATRFSRVVDRWIEESAS